MGEKKGSGISRREFTRRAAMASAAASFAPAEVLAADPPAVSPELQQSPDLPKLSPEGQAEVEARIHAILSQHGKRFTEEQKKDIHRLCALAQPPLDHLRAYPLENSDGPALYLKPLVEREKKPASPRSAAKPAAPAKKN
jgi:hypothetical protein